MSEEEQTSLIASNGINGNTNVYGSKDASIDKTESHEGSAAKSIGNLGSLAIAVNSLAGPAVLQLSSQYQQSGLIPTTLCLIFVGVLSSFCSLHMANVVSQIPNNKDFGQCIEFSDPFAIFWNRKAYYLTQGLFFLCTVCLNVAAIVDTAEVVDSFLGLHYKSYAWNAATLQVQTWRHEPCTRREVKLHLCDPFADEEIYGNWLLTAGYVITTLVYLPICLMDLKENAMTQIVGFVVLLTTSAYFCWIFAGDFSFHHVSLWGTSWSGMLGVILFNFALVLAIPAWVHEKKDDVSVHKIVIGSTCLSTGLYILVGALGAYAIPKVNVNMLQPMVSGAYGTGIQITGSIFAFFIIGLDIPLFSVLTRYNLTHSGMCSDFKANMLVVWIPWATSWLLYQGDAIGLLLDWGGVLLTSAVAFLLPLYLALRVWMFTDQEGSIQVYGVSLSRRTNFYLLAFLLFIASMAVTCAIVGQVVAVGEHEDYIHSESYLNGTLSIMGIPVLPLRVPN